MLLVTLILVGIAVVGVGVTRLWWSAQFAQALAEGRVGRSLVDHMDEFLEPYEGVQLDEPDLRALEVRAASHFVDALASDGVVVRGWRLVLHNDEVLGPRAFVKSSAGVELSLADFVRDRREGKIDLEAG
jgi:hypothetical protein